MKFIFPKYYMNYPGHEKDAFVDMGVYFGQIPTPRRWGYIFEGWYTDPSCCEAADINPASDEAYYAGWRPWTEAEGIEVMEIEKELQEAKYRIARPKAYTWDSFKEYYYHANMLIFQKVPYGDPASRLGLKEAEKKLVQIADPEDGIWYIWGEQMPQAPDADAYDYYTMFDYPGFRPFLIPYMLEDQSQVKGNIIVIAGGGFFRRYNQTEGYCVAKSFNDYGYNAFVLQRRVEPSTPEDAYLDLQRSVRYLKYYAGKLGIGRIENLGTCGFSGGGMTITGQLEKFYGMKTGKDIYPDYEPDAMDAVDSDYKVAMPIYGGFAPGETDNPNIPSIFAMVGARDPLMIGENGAMNDFFNRLNRFPEYDMELHIFAGIGHGYGTACGTDPVHNGDLLGYVGPDNWMKLADDFMMVRFGLVPATYEMGKRPI